MRSQNRHKKIIALEQYDEEFKVPIYGAYVRLIVAETLREGALTLDPPYEIEESNGAHTFFDFERGHFALLFKAGETKMEILAHEVFHLSHRIAEWCGLNFDSQHHESVALLHGWLFDEVYRRIGAVDA